MINISNIETNFPGAAGLEARMLPLSYSAAPLVYDDYFTLILVNKKAKKFEFRQLVRVAGCVSIDAAANETKHKRRLLQVFDCFAEIQ